MRMVEARWKVNAAIAAHDATVEYMQLNVCEDGRSVCVICEMSDGTDIVCGFDLPSFVDPDDDDERRRLMAEFPPTPPLPLPTSGTMTAPNPQPKPLKLVAWECSEFEIQVSLVDALRKFAAPDCLWLHIGNGERRDVITGSRLKRMGVRPGAADLLFLRAGTPPLFLELKTSRGVQSESQRAFEAQAITAGCEYKICRSLDHALTLLFEAGFCRGGWFSWALHGEPDPLK